MSLASICLRRHLTQPRPANIITIRQALNELHTLRGSQVLPSLIPKRCYSSKEHAVGAIASTKGLSNVSPEKRAQNLLQQGFEHYPRPASKPCISITRLLQLYRAGSGMLPEETFSVMGRIKSVRSAGSKLLFVDVSDESECKLQVMVNAAALEHVETGSGKSSVKAFRKLIQVGDLISVSGHLRQSDSGDLTLSAKTLPVLVSPCLHQIPEQPVGDDSDFAHDRHVQMLTDPSLIEVLKARSLLVNATSAFLTDRGFCNVQTPILSALAGGATARPFETAATEFAERKLSLRISPELWLKRLLIGGMQRVYEIGPSFRNEGLDRTHNPEFSTCEFYAVGWPLHRLQIETTKLVGFIVRALGTGAVETFTECIGDACTNVEPSSWPSIDFLPALNKELDCDLPDLSSPSARELILEIFTNKGLTPPIMPTLPRLLDKLSSIYLEPKCHNATWIINTPECLSPLAKSFPHPDLPHQRVAARGELFIHCKEVVNCYEEENSPTEQRRKFIDQQKHAKLGDDVDPEAMKIDEDYIRALEWGLPPTGGWGCGIDRLCMLMLGKDKISDVLAFGNLRSVTRSAEKRP